ncbi:hypothetical protein J0H58_39315, partial [bacterium]|nr:hypothetical protein [bacterium]
AGAKPGLRATSAAVRALKYNGQKTPHPDAHAAFVMACFDPATGGFADAPGGKADVTLTSVGVMAAVELGVPKDRFRKSLDYLKANATTFEDVRIAAAAVEAWGVKECPFDLKPWLDIADRELGPTGTAGRTDDALARETASVIAMKLRLGVPRRELVGANKLDDVLQQGQRRDGGYGRGGAASDLESTYRVMRAFMLMRERPSGTEGRAALRAFVAACRNADGGYGVRPGDPSGAGPTYYAAIILHWLADMEK